MRGVGRGGGRITRDDREWASAIGAADVEALCGVLVGVCVSSGGGTNGRSRVRREHPARSRSEQCPHGE